MLTCVVLYFALQFDWRGIFDDSLDVHLDELIEGVQLLPHQALFIEVGRDDHPARFLNSTRLFNHTSKPWPYCGWATLLKKTFSINNLLTFSINNYFYKNPPGLPPNKYFFVLFIVTFTSSHPMQIYFCVYYSVCGV